jgi:hypothetical protein
MGCRREAINNLKKLQVPRLKAGHHGGRFTIGVTETKSFHPIPQEIEDYFLCWYITPFKCI